jgi:carbamate kinase
VDNNKQASSKPEEDLASRFPTAYTILFLLIALVAALTWIIPAGHQLVITHGKGPQVGLLALKGAAYKPEEAYPLDVLGAETDSMIGYIIEQELENALDHHRPLATLFTQVLVDKNDPAFSNPRKFVGPTYDKAEAESKATAAGWHIAQDGDKWRRVVPSPQPLEIPDLRVLKLLLAQGVVIICAGGGVPILRREDGSLMDVEAVIDKDAASALLARQLGADALLLLTDEAAIYRDFDKDTAAPILSLTLDEARNLNLSACSMGPKLTAASDFASSGGLSGIGRLEDALAILERRAGACVTG